MQDDLISRKTAQRLFGTALTYKEAADKLVWTTAEMKQWIADFIEDLPSAQPDLSEASAKAVWEWLLDYQIKAAELNGKYSPYEVLSWVANDWRKGYE